MIEVNVRGYSRGIPTLRTQNAMKQYPGESLLILVDTGWAKDDITRLGTNRGYTVKCERSDAGYSLELKPIT